MWFRPMDWGRPLRVECAEQQLQVQARMEQAVWIAVIQFAGSLPAQERSAGALVVAQQAAGGLVAEQRVVGELTDYLGDDCSI
jgi:hypothetical protein